MLGLGLGLAQGELALCPGVGRVVTRRLGIRLGLGIGLGLGLGLGLVRVTGSVWFGLRVRFGSGRRPCMDQRSVGGDLEGASAALGRFRDDLNSALERVLDGDLQRGRMSLVRASAASVLDADVDSLLGRGHGG